MKSTEESMIEMVSQIEQVESDPDVDLDSTRQQEAGWVKFYIECPNCLVPMARTVTESKDIPAGEDERRSRTQIRAVCPECREVESVFHIHQMTQPFGETFVKDENEDEDNA